MDPQFIGAHFLLPQGEPEAPSLLVTGVNRATVAVAVVGIHGPRGTRLRLYEIGLAGRKQLRPAMLKGTVDP